LSGSREGSDTQQQPGQQKWAQPRLSFVNAQAWPS
jgi:hypothetical protein